MTIIQTGIAALGKKLKRRTLTRAAWSHVHHTLRAARHGWHYGEARKLSDILDRHTPTVYDTDPLALRWAHAQKYTPWYQPKEMAKVILAANGRFSDSPERFRAMNIRGYYDQPRTAHLPDGRGA